MNYEPNYKDISNIAFFKIKPLIPEIPKISSQIKEQAKKHVGERRSRLVVVAWWAKGGKWLCRCDCGYYVVRHLSFLEKKDKFDACVECRFVIRTRRESHLQSTGKALTEEYFA